MHNEITEADYKKCLEDFIECLKKKYSCKKSFKSLQILINNNYQNLSIIFKHNASYFYFSEKTFNRKTYNELFKGFIKSLHLYEPLIEKQFGKTYYEIRLNCDLMMNDELTKI